MTDLAIADYESYVIGLALRTATTIDDLRLIGDDFLNPGLGELWDLMRKLHHAGTPTDPATLAAHLPRMQTRNLEPEDLAALYGGAPAGGAEHYAFLVSEAATRRRLRSVGQRIIQLADETDTSAEAIEYARSEVDGCSTSIAGLHLIGDELGATIARLDEPDIAIPTAWHDLNHLISGLRPGGLYIVGARPGVGKSLMANGLVRALAEHGGVAYNNLEMSRHEVYERMLAAESSVQYRRFTNRCLDASDYERLAEPAEHLERLPISVDDRATVTVTDIRSHARSMARRGPMAGVVVDYLQLMGGGVQRNDRRLRHEVVGEISRALKILAKEMDVPVVALSQLNRQSAQRSDPHPTMADLRESGSLEQDADVILLLHMDDEDPTTLEVAVAKNRQGSQGKFKLKREGHYARLDNYAWSPTGML
jgi:replicative DNA helicase